VWSGAAVTHNNYSEWVEEVKIKVVKLAYVKTVAIHVIVIQVMKTSQVVEGNSKYQHKIHLSTAVAGIRECYVACPIR
jgi:hypothetical protein